MADLARKVVVRCADIPIVVYGTLCGRTVGILGVLRVVRIIEVNEPPGKLAVLVAIVVGQNAFHVPVGVLQKVRCRISGGSENLGISSISVTIFLLLSFQNFVDGVRS